MQVTPSLRKFPVKEKTAEQTANHLSLIQERARWKNGHHIREVDTQKCAMKTPKLWITTRMDGERVEGANHRLERDQHCRRWLEQPAKPADGREQRSLRSFLTGVMKSSALRSGHVADRALPGQWIACAGRCWTYCRTAPRQPRNCRSRTETAAPVNNRTTPSPRERDRQKPMISSTSGLNKNTCLFCLQDRLNSSRELASETSTAMLQELDLVMSFLETAARLPSQEKVVIPMELRKETRALSRNCLKLSRLSLHRQWNH